MISPTDPELPKWENRSNCDSISQGTSPCISKSNSPLPQSMGQPFLLLLLLFILFFLIFFLLLYHTYLKEAWFESTLSLK